MSGLLQNHAFDIVRELGCRLRDVQESIKYDGSPVLKVRGVFMAGLAMHPSAEPDTLIVRTELENRAGLLEDAPETYYLTGHYRRHPVVLVRLGRLDPGILRELLAESWRLASAKRHP